MIPRELDNGKKGVKKISLVGSKQARSNRFGWASKLIFHDPRIERLLGLTESCWLILFTVLDPTGEETPAQELVQDLLSIIAS
jgi:hypothetical protein